MCFTFCKIGRLYQKMPYVILSTYREITFPNIGICVMTINEWCRVKLNLLTLFNLLSFIIIWGHKKGNWVKKWTDPPEWSKLCFCRFEAWSNRMCNVVLLVTLLLFHPSSLYQIEKIDKKCFRKLPKSFSKHFCTLICSNP